MSHGQNATRTKCHTDKMPHGQDATQRKCHTDNIPPGHNTTRQMPHGQNVTQNDGLLPLWREISKLKSVPILYAVIVKLCQLMIEKTLVWCKLYQA